MARASFITNWWCFRWPVYEMKKYNKYKKHISIQEVLRDAMSVMSVCECCFATSTTWHYDILHFELPWVNSCAALQHANDFETRFPCIIYHLPRNRRTTRIRKFRLNQRNCVLRFIHDTHTWVSQISVSNTAFLSCNNEMEEDHREQLMELTACVLVRRMLFISFVHIAHIHT